MFCKTNRYEATCLLRVVHLEFDRMRGHFETRDFDHLQFDEVATFTPPSLSSRPAQENQIA